MIINTPADLVCVISEILPDFSEEWDNGEAFCYENGDFSFHSVFMTLGPVSFQLLSNVDVKVIKKFCKLVNRAVEQGGDLENAISTCFLEHASQIGVRKLIAPYLSKETKRELR